MKDKTQLRMEEICRRVRRKRERREKELLSGLCLCCVSLLAALRAVLGQLQPPGMAGVAGVYGSVLLHEGTGAYIVVGIAAFVLGAVLTILCYSWKEKRANSIDDREESL